MKKINERPQINRRQVLTLLGGAAVIGVGIGGGITWWNAIQSGNTSTPRPAFPRAASTGKVQPYTLTATQIEVKLGKKSISTWGYNNMLPGPEIRVMEGDTLRVTVQNQLPTGTTIHWHGVPLVNAMDGVDGVTQNPIKAGGTFTYDNEFYQSCCQRCMFCRDGSLFLISWEPQM
jgi:multicopper oxidase